MRPPFHSAALVFLLGVGLTLLSPQTAVAQNAFVGTWDLVLDSISGHIPGLPPPPELGIAASGEQIITVKKGQIPVETYCLDGSETDLQGYRKGMLVLTDTELTLTTTRLRPGSDLVTIVTDDYQLAEKELLVHRTLRVERLRGVLVDTPGGIVDTPQNRWEARYRRR